MLGFRLPINFSVIEGNLSFNGSFYITKNVIMTRYAHSVRVFLEGKTSAQIKTIGFNGKEKDNHFRYDLFDLDDEEREKFWDFIIDWDNRSGGLFVPQHTILAFTIIVKSLFKSKYKIRYEWIGGADPYKAWKKAQDEAPPDAIY